MFGGRHKFYRRINICIVKLFVKYMIIFIIFIIMGAGNTGNTNDTAAMTSFFIVCYLAAFQMRLPFSLNNINVWDGISSVFRGIGPWPP